MHAPEGAVSPRVCCVRVQLCMLHVQRAQRVWPTTAHLARLLRLSFTIPVHGSEMYR